MNGQVVESRIEGSQEQKPKAGWGIWIRNDFMCEGKRTHQEGTQKSYSHHHQTRSRGNLRECSVDGDFVVVAVDIDIVITVIIVIMIVRPV